VVCDGLIAPAPLDLEALDDWKHNCTADELDPGSIYISGAMSFDVNGVYVPGDEEDIDDEYYDDEGECTNMPVYIKKQYEDDDGVCISLKCVERDDGYCWRIKRGDSKTAVAYVMISMDNVCLPQADMDHSWFVNINGDFQERSQVTARLVQPEVPLPDEFIQKFEKGKETVLDGHSRYLAEVSIANICGVTPPPCVFWCCVISFDHIIDVIFHSSCFENRMLVPLQFQASLMKRPMVCTSPHLSSRMTCLFTG